MVYVIADEDNLPLYIYCQNAFFLAMINNKYKVTCCSKIRQTSDKMSTNSEAQIVAVKWLEQEGHVIRRQFHQLLK